MQTQKLLALFGLFVAATSAVVPLAVGNPVARKSSRILLAEGSAGSDACLLTWKPADLKRKTTPDDVGMAKPGVLSPKSTPEDVDISKPGAVY